MLHRSVMGYTKPGT